MKFSKESAPLIGDTRTREVKKYKDATIFIKLEGDNLTGSLKDRTAKYILDALEDRGELTKEKTVLAPSSGSFAVAIAYQARLRGYKATVVVNEKISNTNLALLKKFGAEVVKHGRVTKESMEKCQSMISDEPDRYAFADQLNDDVAAKAHEESTAPEIFRDVPEVKAIVASMGSGATLCGVSRFIAKNKKSTSLIASVGIPGDEKKITGTFSPDSDYVSPFIKEVQNNNRIQFEAKVSYRDAIKRMEELLSLGFHVGPQTGGVYEAAIQAIDALDIKGSVIIISGDTGLKWVG